MADLRASTKVLNVTAGTAIPEARKYLGMAVVAAAAAVTVVVYKGAAATAGNELGVCNAAIGTSNSDSPGFASDVDVGAASHGAGGIFVVVTGAGAIACVRYST